MTTPASGKDELELIRALDAIQAFIWARIKDEADARNIKLSTGDCYALASVIKEELHPRVRPLIAASNQQAVQKALAEKRKKLELRFVEFDPDIVKLISENLHDLF